MQSAVGCAGGPHREHAFGTVGIRGVFLPLAGEPIGKIHKTRPELFVPGASCELPAGFVSAYVALRRAGIGMRRLGGPGNPVRVLCPVCLLSFRQGSGRWYLDRPDDLYALRNVPVDLFALHLLISITVRKSLGGA